MYLQLEATSFSYLFLLLLLFTGERLMYYGSVQNAEILLFCSENRNFLKKIGNLPDNIYG